MAFLASVRALLDCRDMLLFICSTVIVHLRTLENTCSKAFARVFLFLHQFRKNIKT